MTQMPTASWGLDRIDQRNHPTKDADPFFAYGDAPMHGVEYTLTVTDTETGAVRVHADPFFANGDGFLGGVVVAAGDSSDAVHGSELLFWKGDRIDPAADSPGLLLHVGYHFG